MDIVKYKELEAMKYYDKADDTKLSANLLQKKYDIINNKNGDYMATQKWDGYWMMFIRGESDDEIVIRGRNRNKAGEYENYACKVPHLVEEMKKWPINTVVLGEICWPELNKVATDVGVILRCLPEKARARQQQQGLLVVKIFDCLVDNGREMMERGYFERYAHAANIAERYGTYFSITEATYGDFLGFADDVIRRGGEGCVIQRCDYIYEPGKRSAWKTLKLKQHLDSAQYKVLGFLNPKREYEGKCAETWEYWEGDQAVTRPYALGWKVGVKIELPSGKTCDVSSGMTDADREWAASDEAANLLAAGALYVHVRAMQEATLGGLRHPVFEGWEYDKDGNY